VSRDPADDEDEELPPTLREQGIIALPVHNTGLAGPLPADPLLADGLSPQGRRRWVLANRLAAELVDPPSATRVQGHDLLSAHVISMGLQEVAAVGLAVQYAVLAPRRLPGSTIIGEGTGGSVVRLHGPLYSVVFRFYPEVTPVLVLVDAMPEVAVRVDLDENPRARFEIMQMTTGVLINMQEPGTGEIRVRF
jgi:hypothetical protein